MHYEDEAYAELWREQFNQPLPMLGGGAVVRRILIDAGMSPARINQAVAKARARLQSADRALG